MEKRNMATIWNNDLIYEILSVVEEIPEGKVASYGQIARLIGRLAPHFREQRALLLKEQVSFKENGCVDMKKCQWDC